MGYLQERTLGPESRCSLAIERRGKTVTTCAGDLRAEVISGLGAEAERTQRVPTRPQPSPVVPGAEDDPVPVARIAALERREHDLLRVDRARVRTRIEWSLTPLKLTRRYEGV